MSQHAIGSIQCVKIERQPGLLHDVRLRGLSARDLLNHEPRTDTTATLELGL